MKLLVISHTPHYIQDGHIVGWGPTVREIDHLARIFDQVVHLAVLYKNDTPSSSLPYQSSNVKFVPVRPAGGDSFRAKMDVIRATPEYLRAIGKTLSEFGQNDIVHVRCPSNISLIAILWLAINNRVPHRWVKFAGNWAALGTGSWSYSFQRWLLRNNLHSGVVSVNGRWPSQKPHIFSFYNPSFTDEEVLQASLLGRNKQLEQPLQLLFVGRMDKAKGLDRILKIACMLKTHNIRFELNLVGDGPQKETLQAMVADCNLQHDIHFIGWLRRAEISTYYARAHFLLLPSAAEGWPKVLSEGMAYGVVPLASTISSIPQILAEFGCGRVIPPQDLEGYVQAMIDYLDHPEIWLAESHAGIAAARHFTYVSFQESLKAMALEAWGLHINPSIDQP